MPSPAAVDDSWLWDDAVELGGGGRPTYKQPKKTKIAGEEIEVAPLPPIERASSAYMKFLGKDYKPIEDFPMFDEDRARRVAGAYERMQHAPGDPKVKRSYDAMIDETMGQYRQLKDAGYEFEFIKPGDGDPYAASPALGYLDLRDKGHMYVFPTDSGFGTLGELDVASNPLLRRVGRIGDLDNATANDAFRIVHDAYGHFGPGNPFFRHKGEERAWLNHSRMYSEDALPAMTSETRGQNSWLNFGPYGERNRTASSADTVFADQKSGLMEPFTYQEYADGGRVSPAWSRDVARRNWEGPWREGPGRPEHPLPEQEYEAIPPVDHPDHGRYDEWSHTTGAPGERTYWRPKARPMFGGGGRVKKGSRNVEFVDDLDQLFGEPSKKAGAMVRAHTEKTGKEGASFGNEFFHVPLIRGEQTQVDLNGGPQPFGGFAQQMQRQQMPFFSTHAHPVVNAGPKWLKPSEGARLMDQQGLGGPLWPSAGDLSVARLPGHTMMIESGGLPNNRLAIPPTDLLQLSGAAELASKLRESYFDPSFGKRLTDFNEGAGLWGGDMLPLDLLINQGMAERGAPIMIDSRAGSGKMGKQISARDLLPEFQGYLSRHNAEPW